MAAVVFTVVSIVLYIHRSTGQSYCSDDQFICWSDFTCLDPSYKCDGNVDCYDASDEKGCGDILRECHCKYQPECRSSASCDFFGCQDGWEGYRCAFKRRDKIATTFSPTSTQSHLDTSYDCHCLDQSECNDRFYGTSCYCQEGWKGIRCSEKVSYITSESLGLIGGVIIVLLVIKNQQDQEIQLQRQPVPESTASETREPVQELTTSETRDPVPENTTSETREPDLESSVIVQIQDERDTHDIPDIGSDRDLIISIR
uniref:EGF-like domain-containing protein n=1 Tax=Magallana gigas TaxID=29159 RepID=A0A8W8L1P6_MAGGI